jgi:thioredoxin 1
MIYTHIRFVAIFGSLALFGFGCIPAPQPSGPEVVDTALTVETQETVGVPESAGITGQDTAEPAPKNDASTQGAGPGSYSEYAPEKKSLAADGAVVLFFHAPWCPSCRAANADIGANMSAIPPGFHILKVDYDSSLELKKQYGITYQHTFVRVNDRGEMLGKWSGSLTLADIVARATAL